MEATMLAIFVPLGYVAGWLVTGRLIFNAMDMDDPVDGAFSMFFALFWPVLAALFPAWVFVTWPKFKAERAAERAKIEREKEWAGRQKTAELERQIYGSVFTGPGEYQ